MATIDERIVAMSFENQVFEQRAAQTMTTLTKLDTALKSMHGASGLEDIEKSANKVTLSGPMSALDKLKSKLGRSGEGAAQGLGDIERAGNKVTLEQPNKALDKTQAKMDQLSAGKTFTDIEKASNQVELAGITKAIQSVSGQFSILQNAASVALGGIASNAIQKGATFGKSFAFGPAKQGFDEYQTNLGSIQTILANTQGQQVSGLGATQDALAELNTYSDKTIYNFSEMAKNIGTFTAAGVSLPDSTKSIKGIANLAALSGSNSQQASTAMYQLSQAIASGKVGLQDWNSVVNAGMGGAVFQKSLMRTAQNMGAVEKGAVKIDKVTGKATVNGMSFRDSIMAKPGQKSWLTSEVLTNTLSQLTGDMTDAELAAKGFSAEQIKAIQAQAKSAQAAATEVKTLPQVFDVAKETIGSGWSQTFSLIFGDFNESKKTFTEFSATLNSYINQVSAARNKIIGDWKKLGGREMLIEGLKKAFGTLMTVIQPLKDAFHDVFPTKTGKDLFELTKSFRDFMVEIRPSPETIDRLRRIFTGLFAAVSIGWNVLKAFGGVILDLLGVVGKGSGGFVEFLAKVGDFLAGIDNAIKKGDAFKQFFEKLSEILQKPVVFIQRLIGSIRDLFADRDIKRISTATGQVVEFGKALSPLERATKAAKIVWQKLVDAFSSAKEALEPWFSSFVTKLQGFGKMIGDALSNIKVDDVMKGVQTGLLAGLLVMVRNLFGKGGGLMDELTKTMGGVNELLDGVTGKLNTMQKKVQAQLILAIAAAVIALAGGVYILSTIDGDKLAKAMTAVAVGLGELMGAMKLMSAGTGKLGALMMPVIAAGIIGLAIAVTILAAAMKIFATMSWEEIGKGLVGVAGSLGVIAGAMRLMPAGPTMIAQAGALLVIGLALNAISAAVKTMASMKWEDLGKGLFGLIDALGLIALTMGMMPPNMIVTAAGIFVLSFALMTLAGAVKTMGSIGLDKMIVGLTGIVGVLIAVAEAMWLMPPTMIATAAGLVLVGFALIGIAKAIEIMGNIGVWGIIKGLVALAGAMTILSVGLYLMIGTLPGSLALLAASAALAVLAPTLGLLGNMKWSTIFKGLAAVGLALLVIGTVGVIAAPALALLGVALIPLGLGFMLVAGAAKLFASAMASLGSTGAKGIAVFLTALTGFVAIIPTIVVGFLKGMLGIVDEVSKLAPKVVTALGVVIDTIIAFLIESSPDLVKAAVILVTSLLTGLLIIEPKLIEAGRKLVMDLLNGLSQNIGQVTSKVSEIVVKFLNALAAKTPSLVEAGAKLLKAFLDGVSSKFGEIATSVGNLVIKFVTAVGKQAARIATAATTMMGKFVDAVGNYGPTLLAKGTEVILKFLAGLDKNGNEIIKKGVEVAGKLLKGLAKGLANLADLGLQAIVDFLNGIADAIRNNSKDLVDAGINIGDAILDGVKDAFGRGGPLLKKAADFLFGSLPGWVKKILGIHSPSKVFADIGMNTVKGFAIGIKGGSSEVNDSLLGVAKSSMKGLASGVKDNQGEPEQAFLTAGAAMVAKMRTAFGGQRAGQPSEIFRDLGKSVTSGFKDGLLGSRDDVLKAFDSMNASLIDKIRDLRSQVADGNTKLGDLQQQYADKLADIAKMRSEKKPDKSAIADAITESQDLAKQIGEETKAVAYNAKALTIARDVRESLTGSMHDEKMALLGLKKDYEDITKQLEEAEKVVEQMKADEKKYTEQYSVKPDFDTGLDEALAEADRTFAERQDKQRKDQEAAAKRAKINQVALYIKALEEQLVATAKYEATLQKLRELGLDDETYKRLLDKGLSGSEFAEQLLRQGKPAIDKINAMDTQILAKSTELAKQATKALYDSGVQTAQGLVDGLKAKKAELGAAMEDLADMMVQSIKKKLKIKSPSQIFAEVGKFTVAGLASGLKDTGEVEGAVVSLGKSMTDALASVIGDDMDVNPVITPVLDISQLKKDVQGMPSLDNVVPITAATSYGQASAASQEVSASQLSALEAAANAKPSIEYTQNNYSPEALSDVEIYRKTKNQIGLLKSALGVPA